MSSCCSKTVFNLLECGLVAVTNPFVVVFIKAGANEPYVLLEVLPRSKGSHKSPSLVGGLRVSGTAGGHRYGQFPHPHGTLFWMFQKFLT